MFAAQVYGPSKPFSNQLMKGLEKSWLSPQVSN